MDPLRNPLKAIEKQSKTALSMFFDEAPPIQSGKWLINCSLSEWKAFTHNLNTTVDFFAPEEKLFQPSWMVPVDLAVPSRLLNPSLKTFSIFLDSEYFPNPLFEAWPLEARPQDHDITLLRLWVEFPSGDFPLSDHPRFEKGLGLLRKIFPLLQDWNLEPRVGTRERSYEKYQSSLLLSETRHPFLVCLAPYLNCHFPYPQGTLMEAQRLLQKWLGTAPQTKLA